MRHLLAILFVALITSGTQSASAETRLSAAVVDNQLLMSVVLPDELIVAAHDAFRTCSRETVTYSLELYTVVPVWIDRRVGATDLRHVLECDRVYHRPAVTRTVGGRIVDKRLFADERAAREFLATIQQVPVFQDRTLLPDRNYLLRLRRQTEAIVRKPQDYELLAEVQFRSPSVVR
jgi:hypothetical protein